MAESKLSIINDLNALINSYKEVSVFETMKYLEQEKVLEKRRHHWLTMENLYNTILYELHVRPKYDNIPQYFCKERVENLIQLTSTTVKEERIKVVDIVETLFQEYSTLDRTITESVLNHILRVIHEEAPPLGVPQLLQFLTRQIDEIVLINQVVTFSRFLFQVLIPLHTLRYYFYYAEELIVCVLNFIKVKPQIAPNILLNLFHIWPSSTQMIYFLKEVKFVIGNSKPQNLAYILESLCKVIAKCLKSSQTDVIEEALRLIENKSFKDLEKYDKDGIIVNELAPVLIQLIIDDTKHYSWDVTISRIIIHFMKIAPQSLQNAFIQVHVNSN